MTMEDFRRSLDFLERSGLTEVKLLGGEPTIHPLFNQMLDLSLDRDLRVLVLSGGLVPERALRHMEGVGDDRLAVMMNVIPPGAFSQRERDRQIEVLARIGSKVALGLNIDSPSTPLDFLITLINKYGLQRTVRLGLAHPIAGTDSDFLNARHYPAVGRRVADFFWRVAEEAIRIEFDCGWVPCMFPDGFMERSGITPQEVGLRCNPILDVLPGRKVIACYPMAAFATEALPDDGTDAIVAERLAARLASYRPLKIYKHCDSCAHFQAGTCLGGCIAGAMTRVRSIPAPAASFC
jgi:hypothetical protein